MEPLLQRAGQRAAEVERQAAQDIERFASQQMAEAEATEGFASAAEVAAAGAETAAAVETGGALTALGEGALAVAGAAGAATGGLVAAGAAAAVVGTAWGIEGGVNAASHMLGWGAETGGGTDSDASRPSRATDVQTLNGMQESGAIDHFFAQQAPAAAGLPDRHGFRERAASPVSATDQSPPHPAPGPGPAAAHALLHQPGAHPGELRHSRQSRSDRGPLGTQGSARPFAQPSFDALRQASEPGSCL